MQEAFDALWPKWDSELAALDYLSSHQTMSSMDMLLLGAVVDNRRVIEAHRRGIEALRDEVDYLREQLMVLLHERRLGK